MISSDELERYMQQRAEQDAFSGVVLITQGSSQLFAGSYGYASRSWKVPNTLTTRFDTASVTKLFTAVATLQLIDQGVLAFDTPVIDFLGLQGTAISHEVNVFHLLTHTSGIADDVEEESGEGVTRISGRPDPTTRSPRLLTFSPNLRTSLPISRLARDAATVIAALCCWACSSKRSAASPIGTTCASISSHLPACSTLISSAWMKSMKMSQRVAIRSMMGMGVLSPGRKISILTHPLGRQMVAHTLPPAIWTAFCAR